MTAITPFSTTTVVITQPTVPAFPSDLSHQPIPVAAIVGGIIGGASLAVLVTTGWVCWGKSLKRKKLREHLEIESQLQTLRNTQRNATISQRCQNLSDLHPPMSTRTPEPKIRFANSGDMKATCMESNPTSKRLRFPQLNQKDPKPMRLRRSKPLSSNSHQENSTPMSRQRAASLPGIVTNETTSTPSLAPTYATACDETDSTTVDQLDNGTELSFQRFLTKKNWQAPSSEIQRQSVSTYETAASQINDDDI